MTARPSSFVRTQNRPLLKSKISNLKSILPPSPFARRVYAALRKVPAGRVITYAALGRRIGCRSPRAIGQALRANPFAPQVPCHRVIASDLTPGGFNGETRGPQLARKLRLLATEGIVFKNGRLADPKRAIR
jgi:methylated-DNA-[protein]-cysteine S-methyltransferase